MQICPHPTDCNAISGKDKEKNQVPLNEEDSVRSIGGNLERNKGKEVVIEENIDYVPSGMEIVTTEELNIVTQDSLHPKISPIVCNDSLELSHMSIDPTFLPQSFQHVHPAFDPLSPSPLAMIQSINQISAPSNSSSPILHSSLPLTQTNPSQTRETFLAHIRSNKPKSQLVSASRQPKKIAQPKILRRPI